MFRIIIGFIVFSWVLYAIVYPFTDNSKDILEGATFKDLAPYYSINGSALQAELLGFNVDDGIYNVLKDNDLVDSVEITVKEKSFKRELDIVSLSYRLKTGESVKMNFIIADKAFIRNPPYAFFVSPLDVSCSVSDDQKPIVFSSNVENMIEITLASFFENDKAEELPKTIRKYCVDVSEIMAKEAYRNLNPESLEDSPIEQQDKKIETHKSSEVGNSFENKLGNKPLELNSPEDSAVSCFHQYSDKCIVIYDYCSTHENDEQCIKYTEKIDELSDGVDGLEHP